MEVLVSVVLAASFVGLIAAYHYPVGGLRFGRKVRPVRWD